MTPEQFRATAMRFSANVDQDLAEMCDLMQCLKDEGLTDWMLGWESELAITEEQNDYANAMLYRCAMLGFAIVVRALEERAEVEP
jgi:hypothetical protein